MSKPSRDQLTGRLDKIAAVAETTVARVVPAASATSSPFGEPPTLVENTAKAAYDAGVPAQVAREVAATVAAGTAVVEVTPTQVRRPWRSTIRTIVQLVLALATLLPLIAAGLYVDSDQAPAIVTQVLGAAAIVTRVMNLPAVEAFLRQWLPWLAAAPAAAPAQGEAA